MQDDIGVLFRFFAEQIVPVLRDAQIDDIADLRERLDQLPDGSRPWVKPAAMSAIDIAAWDWTAKVRGLPLRHLIGRRRDTVPVYASGGLYAEGKTLDDLAAELSTYRAQGFRMAKIKIGESCVTEQLERVAWVRRAVSDVILIVDAVGRIPTMEAGDFTRRLADLGVSAIQAPLPEGDLPSWISLARDSPIPLIGMEAQHDHMHLRELIERGAVGCLQFNPSLAGGITGALALIEYAEHARMPVTLQCHATAVLLSACLQLGASSGAVKHVELHRFHRHLEELAVPRWPRAHDGLLALDTRTGLGVDIPGEGKARTVMRYSL